MKILVTGSAGFIGAALTERLLERGDVVLGIDNLNDYYDVELKKARLKRFIDNPRYRHFGIDISDRMAMKNLFADHMPECVINLAAQAGVRYSVENPHAYIESNIVGFANVLEGCRHAEVKHLVYASTSSVYGSNTALPFATTQNTDHPMSLYAATKKANESMAHSYSCLYGLPTTGLRFFTVYGPWGRPDMALFKFTKAIIEDKPIKIFNFGKHRRDFTYIDDITEGIIKVIGKPAQNDMTWDGLSPAADSSSYPWRIYNLGNSQPVELIEYITALEKKIGKPAIKEWLPIQPGDIPDTQADVSKLVSEFGYKPSTNIHEGIGKFVEWYRHYFQVKN